MHPLLAQVRCSIITNGSDYDQVQFKGHEWATTCKDVDVSLLIHRCESTNRTPIQEWPPRHLNLGKEANSVGGERAERSDLEEVG